MLNAKFYLLSRQIEEDLGYQRISHEIAEQTIPPSTSFAQATERTSSRVGKITIRSQLLGYDMQKQILPKENRKKGEEKERRKGAGEAFEGLGAA